VSDEWPDGMKEIKTESSLHNLSGKKLNAKWKIRYGGGTFVDGINGHVYHYGPPEDDTKPGAGPMIADHPWDDSYEAKTCPVCGGEPF
jgi:hypothetical protein